MNRLQHKLFWLIFAAITFFAFRQWFLWSEISFGDAPFYSPEKLTGFNWLPYLWDGSDLGFFRPIQNYFPYMNLPLKVFSVLKIPWLLAERLAWYWPFLLITVYSSWHLAGTLRLKSPFRILSPIIYLLNSYILMIVGGGQVSIALAYALFPLTLSVWINCFRSSQRHNRLKAGLVFSAQVMIEPRLAVLSFFVSILYFFVFYGFNYKKWFQVNTSILASAAAVNLFWIFPTLLIQKQPFYTNQLTGDWASFLSFAKLSDTISLLHPNWPENVFGKTYFMRTEFLFIPILAYLPLLFTRVDKRMQQRLLVFTLVSLVGIFLAKGTNPPFGQLYGLAYEYIPGFKAYRDPVKFYFLSCLGYSFLIPFALSEIYRKHHSAKYLLIFIVVYLIWLVRPAYLGQLNGTFVSQDTSQYSQLGNFLSPQTDFFRTLWIPQKHHFSFDTPNHPAIGLDLLGDISEITAPSGQSKLQNLAVKYVIVPSDPNGEIFQKDRQYDPQQRLELVSFLDTLPWLTKVNFDGKITIYQTAAQKDLFSVPGKSSTRLTWKRLNPTKYELKIFGATPPATLVFAEKFDDLWQASSGQSVFKPVDYEGLNSFVLEDTGDFLLTVEYPPQKYLHWGLLVSALSLIVIVGLLVYPVKPGKIHPRR